MCTQSYTWCPPISYLLSSSTLDTDMHDLIFLAFSILAASLPATSVLHLNLMRNCWTCVLICIRKWRLLLKSDHCFFRTTCVLGIHEKTTFHGLILLLVFSETTYRQIGSLNIIENSCHPFNTLLSLPLLFCAIQFSISILSLFLFNSPDSKIFHLKNRTSPSPLLLCGIPCSSCDSSTFSRLPLDF